MAVYIIMTIISMLFAGYAQNVKEVESLDSTYRILGVMAFPLSGRNRLADL